VRCRHYNDNCDYEADALERARALEPPVAISTQGGDVEGSEWWLEHDRLLREAWCQWDDGNTKAQRQLPSLEENLIDPTLRSAVERVKREPTPEHEAGVHQAWEEVLASSAAGDEAVSGSPEGHQSQHRVYRYPDFLTEEGVRILRQHLDVLSQSGVPRRRPNAMNRNGLLLDPSVPGGVTGDPELHRFISIIAQEYLRPLGRSFFPELAGDPADDTNHYAFTIQYGADDVEKATPSGLFNWLRQKMTSIDDISNSTTTDWDLKEHSDASLYTLNINLNLPEEGYSGSSLYFVAPQDRNTTDAAVPHRIDVSFEPGTAILHTGMTRHGARPLQAGKRSNLVVWLHGTEGYVRVAPYGETERMSRRERWSGDRTEPQTTKSNRDGWFPGVSFMKRGALEEVADLRSTKSAEL